MGETLNEVQQSLPKHTGKLPKLQPHLVNDGWKEQTQMMYSNLGLSFQLVNGFL